MIATNQIKHTMEFKDSANRFFELMNKIYLINQNIKSDISFEEYINEFNTEDLTNEQLKLKYEKYIKVECNNSISLFKIINRHPFITWEFISSKKNYEWSKGVNLNPNITWDIVQENTDFNWDMNELALNSNIKWDNIKDKIDIKFFEEINKTNTNSKDCNKTNTFIENMINTNPNLTCGDIYNILIDLNMANYITWTIFISKYSLDLIKEHINIDDSYLISEVISDHSDLTWEFFLENLHLPETSWNWEKLSKHKNITFEIIINNTNYPWEYNYVVQNQNISLDIIEKIINGELWNDKDINFKNISDNPNLNWEFIQKHREIEWDWYLLSCHPNINCDIIEKNISYPWCWYGISKNPNLTFNFIERHINEDWCLLTLCENPFKKEFENIIKKIKEKEQVLATLCLRTKGIPDDIGKEVCSFF
jgi:hypothetical protein